MPSPQDLLEAFIPHPADSTPDTRAKAAKTVMQGLALNDYYFMRRRSPLTREMSGECQTCGCDMVYVEHAQTFMDAQQRIAGLTQQITRNREVGQQMAAFIKALADGKITTLDEAAKIARHGLGVEEMGGGIKMLPVEAPMAPTPPPRIHDPSQFQTPEVRSTDPSKSGTVFTSDPPPL